MVNYVAEYTGDALGSVMETIIQATDIKNDEAALTAMVLTGSVCVNDRWFDFGANITQKDGQLAATHFVSENETNAHATTVSDIIHGYYTDANNTLLAHSHVATPLPSDAALPKIVDVKTTTLPNGTTITQF